jgi:NADH-quinone oxidoreductase subunit M
MNPIALQPDPAMESIITAAASPALPLMVVLPLLFGFALLLQPRMSDNAVRRFSLIFSVILTTLSLIVAYKFDWSTPSEHQLAFVAQWVKAFGFSFRFGVDAISLWLVLLSSFLLPLVVLGSWGSIRTRVREFHVWLFFLQASMVGAFLAQDLIFFYVCFEFTLLPMFMLIGSFGSLHRLRAARVFFLYTFAGSMLTFAGLLYVAWFNTTLPADVSGLGLEHGRWSFHIPTIVAAAQHMSQAQQTWVLLSLLAAFAVKTPLLPLHTWQPLAYSEAPTGGAVLMAAVLAKLGTYGLLRLAIPMVPEAIAAMSQLIAIIAIASILYAGLICWVQKDLKKLIAYSSISHLGFCVLGMFAFNVTGAGGSVFYMVSHGVSTAALLLCAGMLQERFATREMRQFSGLAKPMPIWSTFMVFFVLSSVGLPGLNGFIGEFLALQGSFAARHLGPVFAAVAGLGIIVSAIYLLHMTGKIVWGPTLVPTVTDPTGRWHGHGRSLDLSTREIITLLPLAIACLWLGAQPAPLLRSVDQAARSLVAPAAAEVIRDEREGSHSRHSRTLDTTRQHDSLVAAARRTSVVNPQATAAVTLAPHPILEQP